MNALWLERISSYRVSPLGLESARAIILHKVVQQSALLTSFQLPPFQEQQKYHTLNELLLFEARAAKHFWTHFATLLPEWAQFPGRKARHNDTTNVLLDIGYHHLAGVVKKQLEQHAVTVAPALIHRAQQSDSAPLVYDLMELFRSDVVDRAVLTYLRRKKQAFTEPQIGQFITLINTYMDHTYYLADFKQCHSYRYYMELQLLKFIKVVNHNEVFVPLHLPSRHDTRCPCKNKDT